MIETWLRKFIESKPANEKDPQYSAALLRVERSLEGLPSEKARFIASVAFLMARVAHADFQISEEEKSRMRKALLEQLHLSAAHADAAVSIAVEATVCGAVEFHLVLRRLNELATRPQKYSIVRALFQVACENDVTEVESDQIGNISAGLLLSRDEFIALRSEFREHLSILKNIPV